MTDKQRVEHILKLRKKYCNRNYDYESDIKGSKFSHWVYVFSILDLWNADDDVIQLFYQELAAQISYSNWERKERKKKGFERACKRYKKMVEDAPPNMDTKQWLKYLNRLDILSGRIRSYESNNYPMARFAVGFLRREFFIKTGRITLPSNQITVT